MSRGVRGKDIRSSITHSSHDEWTTIVITETAAAATNATSPIPFINLFLRSITHEGAALGQREWVQTPAGLNESLGLCLRETL